MDAMGQISLLDRVKNLSYEDAYSLLCMVLGAMTESEAWPTLYMVLSEFLPIFEAKPPASHDTSISSVSTGEGPGGL